MLCAQAVHHRAFDLRQVQLDAHLAQPLVDHLKRFQRAQIDLVDRRALQHHVADLRVLGDAVLDLLLQKPRIGEIEAFIHAQPHHVGMGFNPMAQDVAEMLGARHQPHLGDMRARRGVKMQEDRQHHPCRHALFHPQRQRDNNRGQHRREVGFGIVPATRENAEIDKAQHGDDDGGGQRGRGQIMDERRQEQCRDGKTDGRIGPCRRGFCSGIEVDDRAGKAPRDRKTAREGRADVGGPQTDHFLIGVDALTLLGGKRLRDRDRLHEADDRNQEGRQQQLAQQRGRQVWQGERRQRLRHLAHDPHTARVEPEKPHGERAQHHHGHRPGLDQHIRQHRAKAPAPEQRLQPLAHPEQKRRGQHADHHGEQVDLGQMGPQPVQDFHHRLATAADAKDMAQLARRDDQARCGDEPRDHGVRQEIGQKAKPEDAHRQQDQPRQQRQRQGRGGVAHGALLDDVAQRGGSHQGHHGHRPHRQRPAGAKDSIKHDRHDRGVKPCLGRQARKQGIGQRLRDQHDRHDDRSHHVVAEGGARIVTPPCQNGQTALEKR